MILSQALVGIFLPAISAGSSLAAHDINLQNTYLQIGQSNVTHQVKTIEDIEKTTFTKLLIATNKGAKSTDIKAKECANAKPDSQNAPEQNPQNESKSAATQIAKNERSSANKTSQKVTNASTQQTAQKQATPGPTTPQAATPAAKSPTQTTPTTTFSYDRTTKIYANDNVTLLRVEYYSNNKLAYYSRITGFDAATKSYTEKIYQWDYATGRENLIRTDVYANEKLVNSY